ncbi:RNA-directed DNA polymerase [Janthinobacterium sp.]|uniref:RNA-directed DNA polymerase n=1 Tax=Janthinobacterium sp. TaxID=1871054 RepID=UPI0025840D0E|nr:RNA-directed DNA polymerase [Janthinobacterium sp.]MCX7292059.1 RNA-directed DNA polymerase [Janthinobacterium sp.]
MFSLGNLYVAYKKAKAEAFYENTHFHALAFTRYEQALDANLRKLRRRLIAPMPDWPTDLAFLGDYAYLPKSVDCSSWDSDNDGHFRALDPRQDWQHRFNESGKSARATLRLVIRPTVDFQIVSALWIIFVGHLFDASLERKTSFGNRLRRTYSERNDDRINVPGVNVSTPGLFAPYFSAYREWREGGLSSMDSALDAGKSILAITMDIEKFYHRVSPKFLLRPAFLESIQLRLTAAEKRFTKCLLSGMDTWYRSTPDFKLRPTGAIPVGLSASKIIANVLLVEFDRSVSENLEPIYYGRYVDDIFLVLNAAGDDYSAKRVTARIAEAMAPLVAVKENTSGPDSLILHLPYAKDSELVFAGPKQKIFALSSAHGSDLVHHIRDQIRQQSSEYRLLPAVPETGIAMASRALLATPNAALQADALRKADVVSVRRLGFSLLLSDIETYAADLRPSSWRVIREEFYGLVSRHVVTPIGFFEFIGYIPRVFGLMLSCGDIKEAKTFITELSAIAALLKSTTTLGEVGNLHSFQLCLEQYAFALLQAGLQAATLRTVELSSGYLSVLRKLKVLSPGVRVPTTVEALENTVKQVLLADWGRRPYKEYWFQDQQDDEIGPKIPREMAVRRQLRLGAVRRFRLDTTYLKVPHWPALAFPTRPLRIDEIGLVAPTVLSDPTLFRSVIRFLRGAEVVSKGSLGFASNDEKSSIAYFIASGQPRERVRIAVTSLETTDEQWAAAARGKHDRSATRYAAFNGLINRILREQKRPDYIVMPELSIPLRWALRAARKLATNGVSLLAGVEYHRDRSTRKLRNDCLVSLTTFWPGYASSIVVLQSKFEPAHGERLQLKNLLGKKGALYKPTGSKGKPTLYGHRGFFFSLLICSDLTNISHRHDLRGEVDALFALEWNPDTKTFATLVESTANDLHAFVIQANNRKYGDSRIRAPASQDYARDVVQVKGGVSDYYVLGEIDYKQLRLEQRRKVKNPHFKPVPIGYKISPFRK